MKLYIDTSDRQKVVIGLDGKRFEAPSKDGASQTLLPFIVSLLKAGGIKLGDISEIKVNSGPGSFTGLRVGASVAMALGYSLGVPVNEENVLKKPPKIDY